MAPENIVTTDYKLSNFNQVVLDKIHEKEEAKDTSKCKKLTPNLNDKTNYVLHIRNL